MTTEERIKILDFLQRNKMDLLNYVSDIDDKNFMTKPSDDIWSIAELVEHLVLTDESIYNQILHNAQNILDTVPETTPDSKILHVVPNTRYGKVVSAKHITPQAIYKSKEEALMAFNATRSKIENFVETTDLPLKRIAFRHFAFGLLHGKNWLIFMVAHCQRHINQIYILKSEFED